MLGLFSTLSISKKVSVANGSTDVSPIQSKTKKLVIQEWPRLLEKQPQLFRMALIQSTNRSNSIKKALGFADESAECILEMEYFGTLSDTVQAFFYKIIITLQLEDDLVEKACHQLGARHVDFTARGFHSNYWDIFMVCFFEAIDATLSTYITDESKKAEMILAWQRVINSIVYNMRAGYGDRQKEELQIKTSLSQKRKNNK